MAKTQEQENEVFFDDASRALTNDAQRRLDAALAEWRRNEDKKDLGNKDLKTDDDGALRKLVSRLGQQARNKINIDPLYKIWNEGNKSDCVQRTYDLLEIARTIHSQGNSSESVDAATKLLQLHQSTDDDDPSAFIKQVKDQFNTVTRLVEMKDDPGKISLSTLHTIVLVAGLNKLVVANNEALKAHQLAYPTSALDHPGELISALSKAHASDINAKPPARDPDSFSYTSQIRSATPDKQRNAEPCANCLQLTGEKNYHSGKCTATPASAAAYQQRIKAKQAAYQHANATTKPASILKTPATPSTTITREYALKVLGGDYVSPDQSITPNKCLAFLAFYHPEDVADPDGRGY